MSWWNLKRPIGGGRGVQLEPGLVSEVKTKTYNIHAREGNETKQVKRKHMLVLLGLTSRVCITEAFLFYGTEVQWTKWLLLSLFTK